MLSRVRGVPGGAWAPEDSTVPTDSQQLSPMQVPRGTPRNETFVIPRVSIPRAAKSQYVPGTYEIVAEVTVVRSDIDPGSVLLGRLGRGELVSIVEVRDLSDRSRVRGRLAEGGW